MCSSDRCHDGKMRVKLQRSGDIVEISSHGANTDKISGEQIFRCIDELHRAKYFENLIHVDFVSVEKLKWNLSLDNSIDCKYFSANCLSLRSLPVGYTIRNVVTVYWESDSVLSHSLSSSHTLFSWDWFSDSVESKRASTGGRLAHFYKLGFFCGEAQEPIRIDSQYLILFRSIDRCV